MLSLLLILFCCHAFGYNDDVRSKDGSLAVYRFEEFAGNNLNINSQQPLSRKQKRREKLKKSVKTMMKATSKLITLPTTIAGKICRRTTRKIQEEIEFIADTTPAIQKIVENEAKQIGKMLKELPNIPKHTRQTWFDWKISFVELIITRYIDGGLQLMEKDLNIQIQRLKTKINDHTLKASKKKYRRGKRVKDAEWELTKNLLHAEATQIAEQSTSQAIVKRLQNTAKCIWKTTLFLTQSLKTFTINTITNMEPWILSLLQASFKCSVQKGWNHVKQNMAKSVNVDFNAYDYGELKQTEEQMIQDQDRSIIIRWLKNWLQQGVFDEAVTIVNNVFNEQMSEIMKEVDEKLDAYFEDKAEGSLLDCLRQWLKSEMKEIVIKGVSIIKQWLPKIFNHAKASIAAGFDVEYDKEQMDVA